MPDLLIIRRATSADAADIGRIYDQGVRSGVATFARGPHPADERRSWLAARSERAPVYCGVVGDEVRAWSALAPLSHREWYSGAAEYTVYVDAASHGAGLGGQMLRHLIARAPEHGYWKLVGLILPENRAGLALARSAGFRVVGTYLGHTRVDGRWRDVTIVERHLQLAPRGGRPQYDGSAAADPATIHAGHDQAR